MQGICALALVGSALETVANPCHTGDQCPQTLVCKGIACLLGNRPPSVTSHRMMCTTYCKKIYGCIVPRISSSVRFGSIGESPHYRPLMEFSALGTSNSKRTAL